MKEILITGVAGFAGRRIAEYLQSAGFNVCGVVRNRKGADYPFPTIEQDLSEPIECQQKFDAIVHAAGKHPGSTMDELKRNNIDAMSNLIEFARTHGVRKIIYLSTTNVNGEIRAEEIDERTDVLNPDPYGLSKYVAELLLKECKELEGVSLRLPGIVGAGAQRSWLPSVFDKFKRNETVTIYSPEFEINNFVHVEDIAKFIEILLKRSDKYLTFVLGTSERMSVRDCVETLKSTLDTKSVIEIGEPKKAPFALNVEHALAYGFSPRRPRDLIFDSFATTTPPRDCCNGLIYRIEFYEPTVEECMEETLCA